MARESAGRWFGPLLQWLGVDASDIHTTTNLKEKYGFDSLMWVELSASLETVGTGRPDPQILSECETVADVVTLVGAEPDPALLEGPVEDEEINLRILFQND